jgi:hypothetical protein
MRALVAALLMGLVLVPAAQAKLNPSFNERVAMPGDTIELDLGRGIEQFHGPLRIFLVSLEGTERRQFKIAELGTPGECCTPRVLRRAMRIEVPDLPVGDYTVAIWFDGYATGTWENVFEGISPLLTIGTADEREASPAPSEGRTGSPLWVLALTVGGLGAGLVAWGCLRAARRAATGIPTS